jgi:hypothetical protein
MAFLKKEDFIPKQWLFDQELWWIYLIADFRYTVLLVCTIPADMNHLVPSIQNRTLGSNEFCFIILFSCIKYCNQQTSSIQTVKTCMVFLTWNYFDKTAPTSKTSFLFNIVEMEGLDSLSSVANTRSGDSIARSVVSSHSAKTPPPKTTHQSLLNGNW